MIQFPSFRVLTNSSHPINICIDLQPRRVLRSIQDCLDKLAGLASTSTFCLPLDLPLHQSLPICLFSSATTQDGQLATAGTSAGAAVATTTAAAVGSTTVEVCGAGLEQGKNKEEAYIIISESPSNKTNYIFTYLFIYLLIHLFIHFYNPLLIHTPLISHPNTHNHTHSQWPLPRLLNKTKSLPPRPHPRPSTLLLNLSTYFSSSSCCYYCCCYSRRRRLVYKQCAKASGVLRCTSPSLLLLLLGGGEGGGGEGGVRSSSSSSGGRDGRRKRRSNNSAMLPA